MRVALALPLVAAHMILAAAIPACSSTQRARPAAAHPEAATAGNPLSTAEGTAGTGPVVFSQEPMGGRDNAAAAPSDNTPRVIPFHKAPPPREIPR